MKKKKLLSAAGLTALLISCNSQAVTFNYRHEVLPEESRNKDRILISHTFENNLSISSEAKWGGYASGDRPYDDLISSGNEFGIGYKYKVNDKFDLAPVFNIDSGKDASTYKFNLKGTYKLPHNFYIAERYRYGDKEKEATKDTDHYHQTDTYIGYSWGKFNFEYDFAFKKTDYALYKNKHRDYEHNFCIQYKVDTHWVPFTEIGYIPYKPVGGVYGDEWQARYRIGVKYNL